MFVCDVCKHVCAGVSTHVEERRGHWVSCCITFIYSIEARHLPEPRVRLEASKPQ